MTTSNSGAFSHFCFGGHVKKKKKRKKKEENVLKKKKERNGPAVAGLLWLGGEAAGPLRATLRLPPRLKACAPLMHGGFAAAEALPFAWGCDESQPSLGAELLAKGPCALVAGRHGFGEQRSQPQAASIPSEPAAAGQQLIHQLCTGQEHGERKS